MVLPRTVLLGTAAVVVLGGCGTSGGGSTPAADTPVDGAARSSSVTGTDPDAPVPDEQSASADVVAEDSRPEPPDTGGTGGVTLSLPSLPVGGSESIGSDAGDTCIPMSYLGNVEEQSIPVGARIRVTAVLISSDLLARGGNGCSSGERSCLGGDAYTDQQRTCGLPVRVAREPRPPAGEEPDPEFEQETVTIAMSAEVDCPPALQQQCAAFARSLDDVPMQSVSVTVNARSSPDTGDTAPATAPDTTAGTSAAPETSAGTGGATSGSTTGPTSDATSAGTSAGAATGTGPPTG